MCEEIMISEGLAKVISYKPNNLYSEYFYELQDAAKAQNKGFWGSGFFKYSRKRLYLGLFYVIM